MGNPPHQTPLTRRKIGHLPDTPIDLILLSIAAGSADAAGYLGLGKIFTANMTGNIVLLGLALSEGRSADTGRTLLSLLAFIVGTCAGGWLCGRVPKKNWAPPITLVIAIEAVLLLAFAILWALVSPGRQLTFSFPLIALLSLSMGLQGAAAYRLGIPGIVTTVVTGTLTSLLTGLMKTFSAVPAEEPQLASFGLQTGVILVYGAAAALSGFLVFHAQTWAGFFPALIALLVVLTRLRRSD
jgi:uncharacterized membrane protein YoaK (UPF0700 family)